jgi:hypothetical protein
MYKRIIKQFEIQMNNNIEPGQEVIEQTIVNEFVDANQNVISKSENAEVIIRKPMVRKPYQKKEQVDKKTINYDNYSKGVIDLKSYKLPELKEAAKTHKLLISGTKPLLMARIEVLFNNTKNAIKIQRFLRGWLVRYSIKLRGPALFNRRICLNDTDFVTMEPLAEIGHESFYSYKDSKNFVYGFNVTSLIQSMKNKSTLENPYNREKLNNNITSQIKTLFKISCVLYPEFREENEALIPPTNIINRRPRPAFQHVPNLQTNVNNINSRNNNIENQQGTEIMRRLIEIRAKPANERINDLFMEIDSLGNYTMSAWFSNLDIRQHVRLYRALYEIWNYRSNLSREVKLRICPYVAPFEGIFPHGVYYNDLTFAQIQAACLTVFENMVYQGVDEDHRKIGTFHALSALTLVSDSARQAMPWLYESVAY